MAQRDYATRRTGKAKKKKNNTPLILTAVLVIIALFAGGLYFLKEKSTEIAPVVIPQEKKTPKSVLPSPPEEVWSYIKALETRTVPIDNDPKSLEKNMRLTAEQKKVLLEMEKEQKANRLKQIEEQTKVRAVDVADNMQTNSLANKASSNEKKFGLQCGAFKSRQQAENIQANLIMSGLNARINSTDNWNRVMVGPVGNRDEAQAVLSKVKAITPCVIIGM
ncbi:SPOR domain-containing protein [Avibacterium paragallinarum]|uniref:SPOR domain-containing protein n=1 Tax=Avibacterium paragallinarum TaxID=728 RepID=UPI001029E87B|nr:SPOR domain-containing protein [Avibacterium paragallinarum]RZN59594.1 cell division protein FtsN [Avibacterium paragallinarum]TID29109.1 hypothetical protein JO83_01030 [Avibacterium paragallinarum]